MQELVRVSLDAMGGDFAPQVTVQGAVEAVQQKVHRIQQRIRHQIRRRIQLLIQSHKNWLTQKY